MGNFCFAPQTTIYDVEDTQQGLLAHIFLSLLRESAYFDLCIACVAECGFLPFLFVCVIFFHFRLQQSLGVLPQPLRLLQHLALQPRTRILTASKLEALLIVILRL